MAGILEVGELFLSDSLVEDLLIDALRESVVLRIYGDTDEVLGCGSHDGKRWLRVYN